MQAIKLSNQYRIKNIVLYFILISTIFGCKQPVVDEAYIDEIETWDSNRIVRLKSKSGWLNLAGLYWLAEGENSFGSGKDNSVIFPEGLCDEKLGVFILRGDSVFMKINKGVDIMIDSVQVDSENIQLLGVGSQKKLPLVTHRSLAWFMKYQDGKLGIRLRDYEHPNIEKLHKIDRFPIDKKWKIEGEFIAFDSARIVAVPDVLGGTSRDTVLGKIVFQIDNNSYEILPFKSGDQYFLVFGDPTNKKETYGAGRFLYADIPAEGTKVILDFNKAYNPPCAFTDYATCPIPIPENRLKVAIVAGEKRVAGFGH